MYIILTTMTYIYTWGFFLNVCANLQFLTVDGFIFSLDVLLFNFQS